MVVEFASVILRNGVPEASVTGKDHLKPCCSQGDVSEMKMHCSPLSQQ